MRTLVEALYGIAIGAASGQAVQSWNPSGDVRDRRPTGPGAPTLLLVFGVAAVVTGMTITNVGLPGLGSAHGEPVRIAMKSALGSVQREMTEGTRQAGPTPCPREHHDLSLTARSPPGRRSWPSADARFSFRQATRQQRDFPREAGARRTYLLESALAVHGLHLVRTSQFKIYQGALQASDPAALRGRIESEHLAEAALDSLEMLPVCDTCATHEGDPT